jgi:thiol-disulfide isomerase/thioredoxin
MSSYFRSCFKTKKYRAFFCEKALTLILSQRERGLLKQLFKNGGVAILFLTSVAALPAWAADQPAAKTSAEKPAAEKSPAGADFFTVPDGSIEELFQFIDRVGRDPEGSDVKAILEYRKKAAPALIQAADKILALKPKTEQAQSAARMKMIALAMLDAIGDAQAGKRLEALPEELQKAGWPQFVREVRGFLLEKQLRELTPENLKDFEKIFADIKRFLTEAPVEDSDLGLMQTTLDFAEQYTAITGKTDAAVDAYSTFAKLLAARKDERLAKVVKMWENSIRRLTLVGNAVKIEGNVLGGKPIDWSKYAGKVVLVDFWATWCGPCLRELPEVKKAYELYHDRGFEIVGISLDKTRVQLDAYLKDNPIPWTIVYNDDGSTPTAEYYGINSIPTMFLVGKDGKVVSISVRGAKLSEELTKLLGKAEEKKAGK